jgi:hypothetical protein
MERRPSWEQSQLSEPMILRKLHRLSGISCHVRLSLHFRRCLLAAVYMGWPWRERPAG